MIQAIGTTVDNRHQVIVGLTPDEATRVLAGEVLQVETGKMDPRFPDMSIVVIGGPTDQALIDRIAEKNPDVWIQPSWDDPG